MSWSTYGKKNAGIKRQSAVPDWSIKAYNRGSDISDEQAHQELSDVIKAFPAIGEIVMRKVFDDEALMPIVSGIIDRDDPCELEIAHRVVRELARDTNADIAIVTRLKERAQAAGETVRWDGRYRRHIPNDQMRIGLYGRENEQAFTDTIVGLSRLERSKR